jgi:hypothetical protein
VDQVRLNPADFDRFLRWRAECLERQETIEAMDDATIPEEFEEHVRRYRFGRASAIVDREPNPEAAGVAAVRSWLQTRRPAVTLARSQAL